MSVYLSSKTSVLLRDVKQLTFSVEMLSDGVVNIRLFKALDDFLAASVAKVPIWNLALI